MTTQYNDWAVRVAAEIAAERKPSKPAPESSAMDKLKVRVVAAELAQLGVTDPARVQAVAARMTVNDAGDVVGLDRHGVPAVGTGPGYFSTVSDVLADLGETTSAAPAKAAVILDPKAPGFSLTAAMVSSRNDPVAYEALMSRLAPRPLKVF